MHSTKSFILGFYTFLGQNYEAFFILAIDVITSKYDYLLYIYYTIDAS